MLYHGPVRVPADAVAGKANVRVRLTDLSKYKSMPTDVEVELVSESE